MGGKRLPLRWTAVGGAAAVLVLAAAGATFAETAAVRITVPPQRIDAHVTLNLDSSTGLTTRRIESHVTDVAQGMASGTVTVAPAYATGSARLMFVCPAATAINPCPVPYPLPAHTVLATFKGVKFLTQAAVIFTLDSLVQNVAIRAMATGAAGNQPPGAIELMPNGPRQISVFNPYATSGGVDGGTAAVVQQSDIDAARATLATRVTDHLTSLVVAQTGGLTYATDGPPSMDITSDHAAGDQAQTFSVTMTGTLVAYAFSSQDAQAMLRTVMQPMVWPGYELLNAIDAKFTAVQGGAATVSVDAVGYAVPKVSTQSIRRQLTGLGTADAYARLRQQFPGSSVEVRTTPLQLPWLPVMVDHITVTLTVQSRST